MIKTICDICGATKAISCSRCGINVCKIHMDLYLNNKSEYIFICRNCRRTLFTQETASRTNRWKYQCRS